MLRWGVEVTKMRQEINKGYNSLDRLLEGQGRMQEGRGSVCRK